MHRTDCTNASELRTQPEKLLEVEWAPTGQSTFLVNIQVEALDRARLLADITMVLSDAHVNILSANLQTTRNRVAKSRFTFEMAEAKHLDTSSRRCARSPASSTPTASPSEPGLSRLAGGRRIYVPRVRDAVVRGALDRAGAVVTVVCEVASFFLLVKVLQAGMPLGVAYGVWSALGVAATAVLGWVMFDEAFTG